MKEIIDRLKKLAENIQAAKLDKQGEGVNINSYMVIDEYHEWRTISEDFFDQYFDDSNFHYQAFKSLPREGNGYVLMSYFDQQYPIFKILIKKMESGELMKKLAPKIATVESKVNPGKKIFISHSAQDEKIVRDFVDLILHGGLSVPINEIFSITTDGTKIESGADWRDSIKESLISAKVNFLIITPNYKESEVCLNEMGAAWIASTRVIPLIVEPINYKTVGVIQEPNQIEKLLDEKSLDRIRDIIQMELNISAELIKSDRWTEKKNEFIKRVKQHLAANPFQIAMDRNTFDKLQKESSELGKTNERLQKINTILSCNRFVSLNGVAHIFMPNGDMIFGAGWLNKEWLKLLEEFVSKNGDVTIAPTAVGEKFYLTDLITGDNIKIPLHPVKGMTIDNDGIALGHMYIFTKY